MSEAAPQLFGKSEQLQQAWLSRPHGQDLWAWLREQPAGVLDWRVKHMRDTHAECHAQQMSASGMWRFWGALEANPHLDATWWATSGVALSGLGTGGMREILGFAEVLAERLVRDTETLRAILDRLATPGAFRELGACLSGEGEQPRFSLGVPSAEWCAVAYEAIHTAGGGWAFGNALERDERTPARARDDLLESQAVVHAVMRSYRPGLLLGLLDPVPIKRPHDGKALLSVEELLAHACAVDAMAETSLDLIADAGWGRTLPVVQWIMTDAAKLLDAASPSDVQVREMVDWAAQQLPEGSRACDAIALISDVVAGREQKLNASGPGVAGSPVAVRGSRASSSGMTR